MFKRKKPDHYLCQTIQTNRFQLENLPWRSAFKLTYAWARNPDFLHAFMYSRSAYNRYQWAVRLGVPDKRTYFVHAIRPNEGGEAIGAHCLYLTPSGTAKLWIGLNSEAWWGEGVFEEARAAILDHFSRSPRVVRFAGVALARNVSSVYNYKKLGFRLIGIEKKVWRSPLDGNLHDTMRFECLAEDWRSKRQLELI